MTELYEQLNQELKEAGVPSDYKHLPFEEAPLSPVAALVNGPFSAKPYKDILLRYAPQLQGNELEMVVRALSEKGLRDAVLFLLSLFQRGSPPNSEHLLWAAGNALRVINDKTSYIDILDICKDGKLGGARQMLMDILAKIKTTEAYETLLECIHDPSVRGHAIEALGRFGNPEAIPVIESLEVKKGLYEYKAKATALRRLRRKLGK